MGLAEASLMRANPGVDLKPPPGERGELGKHSVRGLSIAMPTRTLLHVTSQEEFDQHMADLADRGQTGTLLGGVNSEDVAGLNESEEGAV